MITFNMFLLRILSHFCKILNRDENIEDFLRNSQYGCYGNVLYRAWLNRYKIGIKCFCKASKRLISVAFILPANVAVTYEQYFYCHFDLKHFEENSRMLSLLLFIFRTAFHKGARYDMNYIILFNTSASDGLQKT